MQVTVGSQEDSAQRWKDGRLVDQYQGDARNIGRSALGSARCRRDRISLAGYV